MSRDEMSAAKNNENGRDHQLDRIVFIGRTYDEYRRMFRLHERNLVGRKILDCPAGSCSFAAEMGFRSTAEGREPQRTVAAMSLPHCLRCHSPMALLI